MNTAILHIGDLHIKDRKCLDTVKIKKIVDTFNAMPKMDDLIIIITGDIAFSGKPEQYEQAKKVIGHLIATVRRSQKYDGTVRVYCVPGNHDVDHGGKPTTSEELQAIRKNNQYDKCLNTELNKQAAFFEFSLRNGCFEDKSYFAKKTYSNNGCTIEFNLINSGIFSILEEDKGLHYFPKESIETINTTSDVDFVFTVMHHAPEWYTDEIKNVLEETIYSKSSIVFLGHEHYIAKKGITFETGGPTVIQSGGCLCNNEDWSMSAFHLGLLNTCTREYYHTEYKWNATNKQYEPVSSMTDHIPEKSGSLIIDEAFREELKKDNKHELSSDFRDYYVFPRIRSEERINGNNLEFSVEDGFISEILSKRKVLITGVHNSGKTSLLKKLFFALSDQGFTPILCDADNIGGRNIERIIRNAFEDCYGDLPFKYIRFCQLPIEKRILLVDDIDLVKTSSLEAFWEKAVGFFGCIVCSSKQLIDVSLFARMKSQLKTSDSISRYSISPLYADKRKELITKVVFIRMTDPKKATQTANRLAEAITSQRHLIPLEPDFIIKYVECYLNNIGEISDGDSGVFSKVFEANLTNAINANLKKKLTVEKVFILLAKVAHHIHFMQKYPLSSQDLLSIIGQYNDEYGSDVDALGFIEVVSNSRILIPSEDGASYRFSNNSQLAYFVAREVNSQYHQNNNEEDICKILRLACFGINSDILLFMSYITDNINILRLILNAALENTKDWIELDFRENLPGFLKEQRDHLVALPSKTALSDEEHAAVKVEIEADAAIQTTDIYDYSEEDADQFVNQFVRSVQLLTIIARCLPSFEHMMPKEDKWRFVSAIYELPNKIFNTWANEANKEVDEILSFFKSQSQDYFAREKKVSDKELLKALQWSAMSLLLDVYHLPVFYATKDNTIRYLSGFNYSARETYQLEHLMMLGRNGSQKEFTAEASRLFDNTNSLLYSTMVRRVVGHFLVFRSDFDYSIIQQLQTKFFPGSNIQKGVLVQRLKNKVNDVE